MAVETDLEARKAIGQKLVGGFPGKELNGEFIALVREYQIGNVILFSHNIESGKQLRELCENIQELMRKETGHSAFITIDQEGGTVTRLPRDGVNVPGAMALAAAGDTEFARMAGMITAHELKGYGVNFNLAPSLDINSNPVNPVIGVRSYGDTAETVTAYGCAALAGYANSGVLAAAKHFPGHGDTAVDSHIGLPVIDKSWEELEELELKPFRAAIAKGVPGVMTSHILFPQLEAERIPCTMSRKIITGLLRERLGFQGLVLSDCMEMDAIQKYYGTAKGVAAAMAAGVDLVFVSHSQTLMREAVAAVYEGVENGTIVRAELLQSAEKILKYKKFVDSSCVGKQVNRKEQVCEGEAIFKQSETCGREQIYERARAREQSDELRRKSIALVQGKLFPLGDQPLFAGCADYRASRASSAMTEQLSFPEYMQRHFGGDAMETGRDPGEEEIRAVAAAARKASAVVLCTYNGHLMPGQMKLLAELARQPVKLLVAALRNPYDLAGLPPHVTGICAWDYSEMTLAILAEVLAGKWIPQGHLPIALPD